MAGPRTPEIIEATLSGERLSAADAVTLLESGNLLELGAAANEIRQRHNDPGVATYIVDRNINYTNVCVYRCQFCAFYRPSAADPDAYVLPLDEIGEKIHETIDLGGTGILLQGGVHADLQFAFYEDMFRFIRTNFPTIHLHASRRPRSTSSRSHEAADAGRDRAAARRGPPVDPRRRRRDSRRRRAAADLGADEGPDGEVGGRARDRPSLGMRTTATMMFGFGETFAQRVEHFEFVRDLQDGPAALRPLSHGPSRGRTRPRRQVEEAGGSST